METRQLGLWFNVLITVCPPRGGFHSLFEIILLHSLYTTSEESWEISEKHIKNDETP